MTQSDDKGGSKSRTMMTGARWKQIEAAFEKTIDQPREKRGYTLAGLDDTLRAEREAGPARAEGVDKLPEISGRAARRMRTPTHQLVGRRLGPYRLVSELG